MSGFLAPTDLGSRRGTALEDELKARLRPRPSTALLGLLATALDAASRLDALASVAPASVREGLIERMAWREAAVGSHRSRHGCIHSIWRCAPLASSDHLPGQGRGPGACNAAHLCRSCE